MAFEEDLDQACKLYSESDAVHLAHAARSVRRQMFGEASPSRDFLEDVTKKLCYRCLVSMILEGPIIKDHMVDIYPPVITAAQILKFKSVKTSKHKELVDRLPTLDLSISYDIVSYDRVLPLSELLNQHHRASPQLTGGYASHASRTRLRP